jgi:diacylglycerol kinase family enzyme
LRTYQLRVTTDGAPCHDGPALFASVFNTPSYGSGMPAVPGARIADAHLDLLVAGDFGRLGALAMLPRLLKGTHLGQPRVWTRRLQSLHIEADAELPLAADGEPLEPLRKFDVLVRASAIAVVGARARRPRQAAATDEPPQA